MNVISIGIVDRIEGEFVIVEIFEKIYTFPKEMFPEDVSEGDVISFNVEIKKNDTEDRRKMMEEKLKKLIDKNS
ncbi:MAG: DUF3006 domain-containing protein [Tissierellales bacterium]|nr:DUF3006 domain-containing protein [Tissierellales bacterium]